jgi:hypothetical protein
MILCATPENKPVTWTVHLFYELYASKKGRL